MFLVSYVITFVIACIISIMRTGFLMTKTCANKYPVYSKSDQKNYIRGIK